ncbi:Uncharacterised protein [Escherichia coli]|nr:Uncharacterised protein [Escherichia coli]
MRQTSCPSRYNSIRRELQPSISYVMMVSSRSWGAASTVNICYVFAGKDILTGKRFLKLACLIHMMFYPVIR